MYEEHGLKGRRLLVEDIMDHANAKVHNVYPEAEIHGRLFHWEWVLIDGDEVEVVAEAIPAVKEEGWALRIKELKSGKQNGQRPK